MKFVKFPSIDNLFNLEIDRKLKERIVNYNSKWVVTEKIDGANIQICITKFNYTFGKRNSFLGDNPQFYNMYLYITPEILELIKRIQDSLTEERVFTLYGEFFGQGIQNRIDYGGTKGFRFYSAYIGRGDEVIQWLSFEELINVVPEDLLVPVIGIYDTFEEASKVNNKFNTLLHIKDNYSEQELEKGTMIAEGVVISPYDKPPVIDTNSYFIKNKNEHFLERFGAKREERIQFNDVECGLKDIHEEFMNYINKNRMLSVCSKEGAPTSLNDTQKYIKLFMQDAKEDFFKEHPEIKTLERKDEKYIFNTGSKPFEIFKEILVEFNKKSC